MMALRFRGHNEAVHAAAEEVLKVYVNGRMDDQSVCTG